MRAKTLLNYNFKGGVGKTTLTGMQAYLLSSPDNNKKVLCVDMDPQANLTEMIHQTYNVKINPVQDLLTGFYKQDLSNSIVHITNNLDIMPSKWNLNQLVDKLAQVPKNDRYTLLDNLLKPFVNNYDYILLDVPPTLNDIVLNAIFAADGISIVLQTQKMSYTSAIKTVNQLIDLKDNYSPKFTFLGVVLYLFSKAKVDRDVITAAKKTFGNAIYARPIKFQERVKGFTANGIKDNDHWDERAIGNYNRVNKEIIDRVRKMIK